MQAPIKRKGSGSQPLDFNAKRARWEDDLLPPRSDSVPTASSSALISGVHTAQIYGGTFTVAGPGSINTTIHNHHYGPQILSVDVLKILNSLPLPNFRDIQLDTLAKATAGTCIWFTLGDMFLLWIEKGKILWGIGIRAAGAGKTILASIVIRDLEWREEAWGDTFCVAYIYLRYSEPLAIRDILESLVKQIVERHTDLLPIVEGLYARHQQEKTKPCQQGLMGVLTKFVKHGKLLFLVLDALDEMRAEDRPVLVHLLMSLDVKLFITSRPLETLQRQFPQAQMFNIAASPLDLNLHIKHFLRHSPDVMALLEGTGLAERIVEAVHGKSGGMFLHAKLRLEALRGCVSALDVEETLETFPTNIEEIYAKTWERILAQAPKYSNLAKLVLLWITHANGEMTIDTLRRAVATSPETHVFEPKRMVPEALLISVCCGLLSVDDKTRIVRLIHYTTRDAILPRILELFPIPHALLAHVCIAHVTACGFQDYGKTAINDETCEQRGKDFKTLIHNDSLIAYAHRSWVHHSSQCDRYPPVMGAVTGLVLNSMSFPLNANYDLDFGGPLHVAALYGLEDLIAPAAQLQSPNAQTPYYEGSPLILAVRHGHLACAKALLSLPDTDVNLRDFYGKSALMRAIDGEHIECLQLLLKSPDIDLDAVDDEGETALILACARGYLEAVKLLLWFPGIDINAVDGDGWTALMFAATEGQLEVVKLLLGLPGININAADKEGWTALMHATRRWGWLYGPHTRPEYGHAEVVKHLLDAPGIDINQVCHLRGWEHVVNDPNNEWTALMLAAHEGYTDIVKHLLNAPGIDVNVVSKPSGETALSHASKRGHREIVDLLLAFPGIIVATSSQRPLSVDGQCVATFSEVPPAPHRLNESTRVTKSGPARARLYDSQPLSTSIESEGSGWRITVRSEPLSCDHSGVIDLALNFDRLLSAQVTILRNLRLWPWCLNSPAHRNGTPRICLSAPPATLGTRRLLIHAMGESGSLHGHAAGQSRVGSLNPQPSNNPRTALRGSMALPRYSRSQSQTGCWRIVQGNQRLGLRI
ncbi:ankyrin repeat-containing domain protein [Coprinopsis sp. MPI-PUGE-AT-0042]|nr:ankyrin repeat-containing domain protein [Coprinopsis sp. MPI-PUGE-AT-0042]